MDWHILKTVTPLEGLMGEIRPLWFMTGNLGKLDEAQQILGPLGYHVSQFLIAGQVPEVLEPQADSLLVVAKEKMRQAREILSSLGRGDEAVLVEDAGLFIDSLGGFPGVYSSHALATIGYSGILRLLQGIGELSTDAPASIEGSGTDRSAYFQAVAALWDGEQTHFGVGLCPGRIALAATEGNGFGFDPIFIPDDLRPDGNPLRSGERGAVSTEGIPFGGVEMVVKQEFSHRRRALHALILAIGAPSA